MEFPFSWVFLVCWLGSNPVLSFVSSFLNFMLGKGAESHFFVGISVDDLPFFIFIVKRFPRPCISLWLKMSVVGCLLLVILGKYYTVDPVRRVFMLKQREITRKWNGDERKYWFIIGLALSTVNCRNLGYQRGPWALSCYIYVSAFRPNHYILPSWCFNIEHNRHIPADDTLIYS